MHQILILKAFEKAKKEINRDEHYPAAKKLVEYISSLIDQTCTPKSLVSKYLKAKHGSNSVRLKPFLVTPLCEYLGYENFQEFEKDFPTNKTPISKVIVLWRKCWIKFLLYHFLLLFIGLGIYQYALRERWMVWDKNKYIKVPFDTDLYGTRLRVYKKERIDHFRKIKPVCGDEFFNPDGRPKVWYGKNKDGELEYFTDLGLHPETSKTLKPITDYMIKTHICPSNK